MRTLKHEVIQLADANEDIDVYGSNTEAITIIQVDDDE